MSRLKDYETVTVHVPTTEDSQIDADLQAVQDIVTSHGGEIVSVERWGKRRMAYEIRKFNEGQYSVIRFAGTTDILSELDRRYKLNERLLRHMTVVADTPRSVPGEESSAVESESGDERPERAAAVAERKGDDS